MDRSKTIRDIVILFVLAGVVLLWNLGTGSLSSWDEGFYGSVSRQIIKTGDWITLYWRGGAWHDKPPLYMWMTALFSMVFGMNEFSVRLFSALSGIGTIILTYLFANKLYSRNAAIASSLVLLSSYHFIWSSKMGMLDIPLTFFITLSLFLFKLGEEKNLCLFLSPIAFSAAFLTKGMAACVVVFVLLGYVFLSGNRKMLLNKMFLLGTIAAIFIAGAWHVAVFCRDGQSFVQGYFIQNILHRSTTAMDGHTGDILTYFGVIPNKGRPWALAGLIFMPYAVWRILKHKEKEHLMPVIWAGCVIALYSLVKTKLHWYIMPVYPALALITGYAACKLFKKHTVTVVAVLSTISLTYLAADKKIFDLDYSPGIKRTAIDVRNAITQLHVGAGSPAPDRGEPAPTIYMYDITDPSMQFYFGDIGKNVKNEADLRDLLKKPSFILFRKENPGSITPDKGEIIFQNTNYTIIKTR